MAFASLKTPQTDALRIAMIQRSLTVEALAEKCGMERKTLSNQISKNFPSRRLRGIVEAVLDGPIWSTVDDFDARKQLRAACGFDPSVLSVPQLKKHVSTLKIRGRSRVNKKAALIALLKHHFQTKPQPSTTNDN